MKNLLILFALLTIVLGGLFYKSFSRDYVGFSNDGPLGAMVANQSSIDDGMLGVWEDLNWLGNHDPSYGPTISFALRWMLTHPLILAGVTVWFVTLLLLFLGEIRKAVGAFAITYAVGMVCVMIFAPRPFLFALFPISGFIMIFCAMIVVGMEQSRKEFMDHHHKKL